jgi:hypothetical protein
MFVVEGVGKRLGEGGVFERVNIVGDSLEEDVLEIGVMGDLVNLLRPSNLYELESVNYWLTHLLSLLGLVCFGGLVTTPCSGHSSFWLERFGDTWSSVPSKTW